MASRCDQCREIAPLVGHMGTVPGSPAVRYRALCQACKDKASLEPVTVNVQSKPPLLRMKNLMKGK